MEAVRAKTGSAIKGFKSRAQSVHSEAARQVRWSPVGRFVQHDSENEV